MANDKDDTGKFDPSIIEERIITPSTLETIDEAVYRYVDESFNIACQTHEGFNKVPVLWLSAERAFQIKNNRDVRNDGDFLVLPIITVERTSVVKDPTRKGIFYGNIPPIADAQGGSIVVSRRINQDKTQNFTNADAHRYAKGGAHQFNFPNKNANKVVYQSMSIPMPVYVTMNYDIVMTTQYQQQMNQMVTPFISRPGGINTFTIQRDGHQYEAFIQENFSQNNNVASLGEDERSYQTTVSVEVLGYLIGDDVNQEQPKIVIRENVVEVKLPREHVIVGDIPQDIDKRGFYRD
mgnify:FL=1|jgi:hypothetical protein|tara:strand:+ start:3827 stop:4708 length:882 start_codon:yes stop_codon:yes gene_type:complete